MKEESSAARIYTNTIQASSRDHTSLLLSPAISQSFTMAITNKSISSFFGPRIKIATIQFPAQTVRAHQPADLNMKTCLNMPLQSSARHV